ncbi:sigma-70 family RNA polymerase sigma factor [Rhodopirellula sallentina]|uniref:RNA polymerase, sigma-24 subunit, ECF subfamily n=1 Tax=Rhodopirellula sallentina SM41 TaxID=1263870 RepID=M5U0X2_9BACT|nr:sigma-70 family RNA polymerase sigma factor [Rhodopirellula sallentina]EMI54919.1 RNA polymerase, sigma-24 subunit, ECF subfamily [Rhodopirellula sallentina SM41]
MDEKESQTHAQFLTLFTANEPAIRAYVRRLVPTRQDAADVMQGTALVLWRKFEELDDPERFRPWAFGIARYEVLGWLRDRDRNRLVLAEDVIEAVAVESAQQESLLDAQRDALADCLEKIPVEQRELVLAAYGPDASIQHVAQSSGRSVAAFYQWLHRVRGQLLECTHRALKAEGLL